MRSAVLPTNEQDRLNALYDYDVLDTEAEKVFDDLTQLASEICETPISLISLVDPDRQWFKSAVGVDVDSTSRDIAFCAHAILEDDIFEITNALKDERFFDNPLVTDGPNIRFYAGTQLTTPSGYNIGTLCVISDKPKQLDARQKKALALLGREVISQLELRIQNKKLEQMSKFKTEFLSHISHEIRTPLNAIIGFSELLLLNDEVQQLSSEVNQHIEQISHSGRRMLGIINSVLDIGKIEAGKMELDLTACDIGRAVFNVVDMLTVQAQNKGVKLTFSAVGDCAVCVDIDEQKLSQVLINLINNAIKFSPPGKAITVSLALDDDQIVIKVADQGIGISDQEQTKLFDKYAQVGDKAAQQEGTGLGLSISKGLVELMSGRIELTSELGKGTEVCVFLPQNMTNSTDCGCEIEKGTQLPTDLSILVVEDNKVNQMVISALLAEIGYQIKIVASGEAALEEVGQNTYQLVFMDINLPGISGIETTKYLKQRACEFPIIALTADVFVNNKERELFDGFLTKPIQLDDLRESILERF